MAGTAVAGARGPARGMWLRGGAVAGQGKRVIGQAGDKRARGSRLGLGALCLVLLFISSISAIAAPPIAWVAPSMTRVGPDATAGSATQIDLYAAKGEYESFQIIVKAPEGGLTGVNVTAPTLQNAQFTLYREHYIYLTRGTSDWATNRNKPLGAGWYPDGLIPFVNPATGADLTGATLDAVPFNLAAGKNQPIWVDVYVPREATAGRYSGVFTVTSNQGQATVTLNLTVWDFTLPVKPALDSSILYWTVRGQLQPEQELLRNRLMPTSINSADASALAAQGLGAANMGFWSGADGSTCTATNSPPSSSSVASTASRYPSSFRLYAYTADEISHCTGLLPTMQQYANALHSAGVEQLITMPPKTDWVGVVDIWVELPKQYVASDVQAAINRGESVWSYNCLQQDDYSPKWLLDYAPINYRIQPGFINQSLGMTGLLYWRADYWTSDPWNNVAGYSASYPAEGLLVYPGQQVGISGVAPSMRLKYLRDGVDDYDYIQLLKQRGQGDWALSIARTIGPDWSNWTRDANALEAARRQLGEKLNGLSSPHSLTVSAAASPNVVASAGTTTLSATATDNLGHGIASWSWSDGGAGGTFSPSASAQNPSYKAAANSSGSNRTVTLTVTATCNASSPVSNSAATSLTVQPSTSTHNLTVSVSASPTTIASAGTTALTASASDSLGHGIVSWSWSDGGAGGTFSPSANVQNPSYTASPNTTGVNRTLTLTVNVTCNGSPAATGSKSVTITEQPAVTAAHAVSVLASASPTVIKSGGTVTLSASASDNQGHTGLAWAWSDNGAGGQFLPSATVKNPTWVAPPNTSGSLVTHTLTVTATCKWYYPWVSGNAVVSVSEESVVVHTVAITASASPTTIASGGIVVLSATGVDSLGDNIASWAWSDGGAGGVFSPSASAQNPNYTAPANTSGADRVITLTVKGTCNGSPAVTGSKSVAITEHSAAGHAISVTASASPTSIASGGRVSLYASATDTEGHTGLAWLWSDNGAGGRFIPSATVRKPTWIAPANTSGQTIVRTLTVTATCKWRYPWISGSATVTIAGQASVAAAFNDIADNYWAMDSITACREAGILSGYPDGSYHPELPVQRDQMAVYIARALAGGDDAVPDGPTKASFSDVPVDHWAYKYVEYMIAQGLVSGLPDGNYHPNEEVNRAQAAAFIARAVALEAGEAGLAVYQPPAEPSFVDVPADYWAYRYIEYLAEAGIATGYGDGSYKPEEIVNRAQCAVYLARAFGLR